MLPVLSVPDCHMLALIAAASKGAAKVPIALGLRLPFIQMSATLHRD